jgi:acyl-coenzyme A thioesterase PaaI-like protein
MDVLTIPFVEKTGITRTAEGVLELNFNDSILNHVGTIYAGAQFVLAEAASGDMLLRLFPELVGKAVPLLRGSQIKYRKPANRTISAHSSVAEDAVSRFKEQYARKGRSTISNDVEIRDVVEDVVTSTGTFNWFVQQVDGD